MSALCRLILLAVIAHACCDDIRPKIAGGSPVLLSEIPFQVSIQSPFNGTYAHICGGSLISLRHVLTAASCFNNPELNERVLRVVAGTVNISCSECSGQTRGVSLIVPHERYRFPAPDDNDIAVLVLNAEFMMTPGLRVVTVRTTASAPGENCTASGWGISDSFNNGGLLKVDLPISNRTSCSEFYTERLTDRMLCAGYDTGNEGICLGDGGGPLICDTRLAGVASFGFFCGTSPNHPGVFTEVAKYADWIATTTSDYQCKTDGSSIESRIFRGPLADIENVPYQAAILQRVNRYFLRCGAVIISPRHVLTLATCVLELKNSTWVQRESLLVIAGTTEVPFGGDAEYDSFVANVTAHPMFYTSTDDAQYNIAVVTIAGIPDDFVESAVLKPIALRADVLQPCDKCLVSGWGEPFEGPPPLLKWAQVSVFNTTACASRWNGTSFANLICTYEGGPSACARDEGGPLVCGGRLAGLILPGNEACTKTNQPSLYIDIKQHADWIRNIITPPVVQYQCAQNGSMGRLSGGVGASIQQGPHQVSIKTIASDGAIHRCGGTLLSMRHVLTTAKCVTTGTGIPISASLLSVVAGIANYSLLGSTEQLRDLEKVHIHPNYTANARRFNMAIVEVSENFTSSAAITAANIRKASTPTCEMCTVFGWNRPQNRSLLNLEWAQVSVFNHSVCRSVLNQSLTDEICTYSGGPGPCKIDEGAALICANSLAAVVTQDNDRCGTMMVPSAYVEVQNYASWIEGILYNDSPIFGPSFVLIMVALSAVAKMV